MAHLVNKDFVELAADGSKLSELGYGCKNHPNSKRLQ
jgi:hypothetical protein